MSPASQSPLGGGIAQNLNGTGGGGVLTTMEGGDSGVGGGRAGWQNQWQHVGNRLGGLGSDGLRRLFLHYDFPPYSTGEVGQEGGGRLLVVSHS